MTPVRLRPHHVQGAVDGFEIIAGAHRIEAFRALGRATIPAFIVNADDLHAELMLIDENLCRNDLSPAERASAQARRKKIWQQLHPETKPGAAGKYRPKSQLAKVEQAENPAPRYDEATAEATGRSSAIVRREVQRGEALGEDALAKVARTSLDTGEELDALAKLDAPQREKIIERAVAGEKVSVKQAVKDAKRAAHAASITGGGTVADLHALAASGFRAGAILADPPWHFATYSRRGEDRSANQHYTTNSLDEIKSLPVADLAAPDCVLFLWVLEWNAEAAAEVIRAWGFEHKTTAFTWVKQNKSRLGYFMRQGYWTRANPERCLLATRGSPTRLFADVQQLLPAPVGEHSEKPVETHYRIERLVGGPYLELYDRKKRPGWTVWGNEVPPPDEENPCGGAETRNCGEAADNLAARRATLTDQNGNAIERKQLPFAISQTINMLARQAVFDLQVAMKKSLDRPTAYTLKAFYAHTTTKAQVNEASVRTRDFAGKGTPAWKYLTPEVFGGTRRMKRFELALRSKFGSGFSVPGRGQELDAFGNISNSDINKILSALGAFPEKGYLANRTARSARRRGRKRQDYFIAHSHSDGRLLGVYRIVGPGKVKPVLIFPQRAPSYRSRFPYQQIIEESVKTHEKPFFDVALAHALATAKP